MKKFLILLSILFCFTAYAQTETLNWYMDGQTYATTTCESGNDILLPTTPTKRGYTFKGWAGYVPIEYLESTGTQWIDTGVVPDSAMKVETSFLISGGINGWNYILGSNMNHSSGAQAFGVLANPRISLSYVEYNNTTNISSVSNRWYNVELWGFADKAYLKIDDEYIYTKSNTHYPYTNSPIALFGCYSRGTGITWTSSIRLKETKIYKNDVLVRDFVPALDSAGTLCMFDKVEHKFYYNAGTGQFIAGPVIGE